MTPHAPLVRYAAAIGAACCLAFGSVAAHADAGALRAKHGELKEQLRNNSYGSQLFIDSAEGANTLQGDVYAVLDHPYEKVKEALQDPNAWCDIMLLPFNTKACRASGNKLSVHIGRKYNQPVEQAYRIDFSFNNVSNTPTFLQSRLNAAQGPVGTKDYRIDVQAVPLEGKTFLHMSYSYGYGGVSKMAMQMYLNTAGADKVGFTTAGMRGAIERNVMRYYLAIDSYLGTMNEPQATRVEKRINNWFTATERYPKQLREMDRNTYVTMKRAEYERQQTAAAN
ncbi:MAG TPA: hypothetical protein VHL79_01220 [Ramlibacter sp.]|jgi:hypothetical protein|nr:hypothetical protein [Ramlibacter sp.]